MMLSFITLAFVAALDLAVASPAACPVQISSKIRDPVAAKGYAARRIYASLGNPRSLVFDDAGHLLVVEDGVGISSLTLQDHGGDCVGVANSMRVVTENSLNHGIALSADGKTLYASSSESAYAYPYNPTTATAAENQRRVIVTNMTNTDHNTRTLLIPKGFPNTLIINRGSASNLDSGALHLSSGRAQIRGFDLSQNGKTPYNYGTSGKLWGWGLRNNVGIAEHPMTSGLFSVENSVDDLNRDGKDIHNSNPGEKLNFLGYVNGKKSPNTGSNFGYPICVGAFDVATIPNNKGITRGSNFAVGKSSPAADQACRTKHTAPRLVFTPHSAPLDIKFNNAGDTAWVSFHGSFDRTVAKGYEVCSIPWNAKTGQPAVSRTSTNDCRTIVSNPNTGSCTNKGDCFRPVGMAFDKKGRMYFTSDSTGELYIVTKANGSGLF